MITAVDTSVLLDVFTAQPEHLVSSQTALRRCLREGALVIGEVVLAELRLHFSADTHVREALDTLGVRHVPMTQPCSHGTSLGSAQLHPEHSGTRGNMPLASSPGSSQSSLL